MAIEQINMGSLVAVTPRTQGTFGQNEKAADRLKRMKAFWADKSNALLHPVGQLLAVSVDATRTIADVVAAGGEVNLSDVTTNGVKLVLATGFKLSLTTLKTWGCPACHSAHGSGVYPSRDVDADVLRRNKFYYRPADRALFVISDTCYAQYAVAILGKGKVPQVFTAPVLAAAK